MQNVNAPFVGRADPLRQLEGALATARGGHHCVVLVQGKAGVGKTALISQFSRSLDGAARVIAVSGDEDERELGFGVLSQVMGLPPESWPDPFAAGAALLRLLGDQPDQPLVLIIDDAHLADDHSLRALSFASRRLRVEPVVILLTSRPELAHRLPAALLRASTHGGTEITLSGLTTQDVRELSKEYGPARLSHRAAARLHAQTDGNPLHVNALLHEVGIDQLEALDQPIPAPSSFAMLVLGGIAQTSKTAQRVVAAAAVLGDSPLVADILAVAEIDPSGLASALEELDRIRIVRLAVGGGRAHFEHALVRAAVYVDLGPATRAGLHRRAADVVPGVGSLRHRIAAAVGPDPVLAADLEADAACQQAAGSLSVATEELFAAARLHRAGPEADRLLLAAVESLLMAGDAAAAARHAAQIARLEENGRQLFVRAWTSWLTGGIVDAAALGRRAWEREDLEAHERDTIAAMLAQIDIQQDRGADAAAWAARALEGAAMDPGLAHLTRAAEALGLCASGSPELGLEKLGWLEPDPRQVQQQNHPELNARGFARMVLGDLADADADLSVTGSPTQGDLAPFRLVGLGGLAHTRFRTGRWTSAQAIADQVVTLAEDMEQFWLTGFLHATASWVPACRGDWTTAQSHVDAAQAAAHEVEDLATAAYADEAAMLLATCRGEPGEVVRLAGRLRARPQSSAREPGLMTWPVHLASALVDVGQLDEAEAELQAMADMAERRRCRSRLAAVARVRGQLYGARRQTEAARDAYCEALRLADSADALERGLALEAYGRFLRRRGERRAAIERLRAAHARFDALGATPFLCRVDEELAACGVADPTTRRTSADALTPQERAVALLISAGRTNQQAADELVVSVKTIGFHLANVYAKLGVHSRLELAGALAPRSD